MTWLLTGAGAVLVLVAVLDIFRTLWHPQGFGGLARLLFRATWAVTRRASGGLARVRDLSGPLSLAVTVLTWTLLVVLGFALVYWPHLPDGFHYGSTLDPSRAGLLTALYVSSVAVTTLGLGDIVPESALLRLVVPLQALVGFLLLTAAISWVLQLYPALGRRRGLAGQLSGLVRPETRRLVRDGDVGVVSTLLRETSAGTIEVHVDLLQYGEGYYFRDQRPKHSLAATGGVLLDLVETARSAHAPEVRHAGEVLAAAVDDLGATLAREFLDLDPPPEDVAAVLEAFARDHRHDLVRLP